MVVLLHFVTQGYISSSRFVQNGFLFVDFFFVLSGFVIGSSYGDRIIQGFSTWRFMWLRLGRIYPLHIVLLAVFLGFEIAVALFLSGQTDRQAFTGPYSQESFVYSLLLVQIFFGPDGMSWNGPSWSIAAEIWTYLIFALLLRHAGRWLLPLCMTIAILAPLYLAVSTDRYMNVVHDGALVRCMFGFSLGMIGWRFAARARAINLSRWCDHLLELALIAATIIFVTVAGAGSLSLIAPFLFLAVVLVFSRERGLVSTLLKFAPFVWVGALSYSIYMIHGFLYYRLLNGLALLERSTGIDVLANTGGANSVGGGALFGDLMTIPFLGLVIACSYFSYRLIELPGQSFARRMIQRREAEPLPATAGVP